uniref:Chitin-binding type-2 domain-containing protein n=1 Tax=Strigamia maritima TaxID=126957 RepID=T1IK23_STRMM
MKLKKGVILLLLMFVVLASGQRPSRQLRFPSSKDSRATRQRAVFRPVFKPAEESGESEEDEGDFQSHQNQRPVVFRRPQNEDVFFIPRPQARPQPQPSVQAHPVVPSSTPRQQQSSRFIPSSTSFSNGKAKLRDVEEEDEEEEKEAESKPDRLTELLGGSKFDCSGKKLGYYADAGLGCEVFHYCADGVRHSWMCPAGQMFHQIHLICMLQGDDNICAQSQKYHFVNDYLYKPIHEGTEETNETLKYHDRFFPDGSEGSEGSDHRQQRPRQQRKQVQHFRQPVPQFSDDDEFVSQHQQPARPAAQPQFRPSSNSGGRLSQFISSATPVRSLRPISHSQRSQHRTPSFRRKPQQQEDDYDD